VPSSIAAAHLASLATAGACAFAPIDAGGFMAGNPPRSSAADAGAAFLQDELPRTQEAPCRDCRKANRRSHSIRTASQRCGSISEWALARFASATAFDLPPCWMSPFLFRCFCHWLCLPLRSGASLIASVRPTTVSRLDRSFSGHPGHGLSQRPRGCIASSTKPLGKGLGMKQVLSAAALMLAATRCRRHAHTAILIGRCDFLR
jgi:hypothetical protein